jgi:hypothetical protein
MDNFYRLLEQIKNIASNSEFTNMVSFGDITDVDLGKRSNFPLVHILVDNANITEKTIDFTVKILACDIVDQVKKKVSNDVFYGNNNVQDILNSQLYVITLLVNKLKRLDLSDTEFLRVEEDVLVEPFLDRFENELAGWEATITIKTMNNVSIC